MTIIDDAVSNSNPFSTRFVRPGAVAYLYPPGESAATLVRRLDGLGWRAQILGPHGSGKSTLVANLLSALAEAGRPACLFTLRDGQRRMPRHWAVQARNQRPRIIIVDGYEQLGWLSRLSLRIRSRLLGCGLLVTAHDDAGFPTLAHTVPSLQLAQALVEQLLPVGQGTIRREMVAECYETLGGDLREMLFALYDRYERAARPTAREE